MTAPMAAIRAEWLDPDDGLAVPSGGGVPLRPTLLIACGALARELVAITQASGFEHLAIACLPAILHNRPERITPAVRAKIRANRAAYHRILCLFGDCGTGGSLDRMLKEEGVERIEGAHCYDIFAGAADFAAMMEAEPGTFFLTDYLARHFDRLVVLGLGLDRYPELRDQYFKHYKQLIYLSQTNDPDLLVRAQSAAMRLGLAFETRQTGLQPLTRFLEKAAAEV